MRSLIVLGMITLLSACSVIKAEQQAKDTDFPSRIRLLLAETHSQSLEQCGALEKLVPGKGGAYQQCYASLFSKALEENDVPYEDIRERDLDERTVAFATFDRRASSNKQLRDELQAIDAKTLRYYLARQQTLTRALNWFSRP